MPRSLLWRWNAWIFIKHVDQYLPEISGYSCYYCCWQNACFLPENTCRACDSWAIGAQGSGSCFRNLWLCCVNLWVSYISCGWSDKKKKNNLKKEGFILVYSLRFECAVHQKEDRVVAAAAVHTVFPVRKWKDFLASFLLFNSYKIPSHEVVLFTFRVALPTSTQPRNSLKDLSSSWF